ncbi:universal stress protein [Rhodococcus sp. SGAir0479]|uniref:universal stress protein n=1 Tax=Rhodococcus sp. SGAir0479 TaxID=2567884 RepID=UPI0010CD0DF6|nr:universal stress protein [Rhodococcus sp. SGAir0479]QCQ92871.1 universal stress protein [Rhodococcus sp. SGAir0479]
MAAANETRPVLVGVDGSDAALHAVRWAAVEAHARKVPLKLVHVIDTENDFPFVADDLEQEESAGREALAAARDAATIEDYTIDIEVELLRGRVNRAFVDLSEKAGLLVVGSVGAGFFERMVLGSTALSLAHHAKCTVAVVRGADGSSAPPVAGPVVAGVDHSDSADIVVGTAMQEAAIRHAEMTAVHARRRRGSKEADEEARARIDRLIATWGAKFPSVSVETVLADTGPTKHLVALSAGARSIVVGNRGRGGFESALLGSTSQSLLYHAQCPVIVARSRVTP